MEKPGLDSFHYLRRYQLESETSYPESSEVDMRSVDDCFAEDDGLHGAYISSVKVRLLDSNKSLGEDVRSR